MVGAACLLSQALSAHAATPDQFAAMQAQLMHASAQLERMVTPQGSVLGATTINTATLLASLKAQLVSLDSQIASLQATRASVVAQIAQLQASGSTSAQAQLIVKSDADSPLPSTVKVSSNATSDWGTELVFDLDAGNSPADISVSSIQVGVVVGHSQGGFNALVAGAELVVDGKIFSTYTATNTLNTNGVATLVFNTDGKEVIKAGVRTPVTVKLRYKAMTSVNEGATVQARVLANNVRAHAFSPTTTPVFTSTGSVTGSVMTLRSKGLLGYAREATSVLTAATMSGQHDYVSYNMKFDLTAFNQDVYIAKSAAKSVIYTMVNGSGVAVGASSTAIDSFTSTASVDSSGQYYVIPEGSTATFTVVVKWTPGKASSAEALQLSGIYYAATPVPATNKWTADPAKDFRTNTVSTTN
jgi:hypothetical protein